MTTIQLQPSPLADIKALRQDYVATLSAGLEGYLEENAQSGASFTLTHDGALIGYCCFDSHGCLWQFHLLQSFIHLAKDALQHIIAEHGIVRAVVSTRDRLALSVCAELQRSLRCQAYLFEDAEGDTLTPCDIDGFNLHRVDEGEVVQAEALAGDFLDDYASYAAQGFLYLLADPHGTPVGLGLAEPVAIHPPYCSVGIFVHPDHRRRGLAAHIIRRLKQVCYDQGMIPIAGCAFGNVGSRRALERAGMVTRDRLLRFEFSAAL